MFLSGIFVFLWILFFIFLIVFDGKMLNFSFFLVSVFFVKIWILFDVIFGLDFLFLVFVFGVGGRVVENKVVLKSLIYLNFIIELNCYLLF